MKQHGFGRNRPWVVQDKSASEVRVRLAQDEGTRAQYPYDYDADYVVTALERGVEVRLITQNTGTRPVPVSPGWHPYFRCPAARKAQVAGNVAGFTEDKLGDDREFDFGLVPLTTGCRLQFRIPELGRVTIDFSPTMRHMQFWSLPGKDFICLEPFYGPNDTINTGRRRLDVLAGHREELWMPNRGRRMTEPSNAQTNEPAREHQREVARIRDAAKHMGVDNLRDGSWFQRVVAAQRRSTVPRRTRKRWDRNTSIQALDEEARADAHIKAAARKSLSRHGVLGFDGGEHRRAPFAPDRRGSPRRSQSSARQCCRWGFRSWRTHLCSRSTWPAILPRSTACPSTRTTWAKWRRSSGLSLEVDVKRRRRVPDARRSEAPVEHEKVDLEVSRRGCSSSRTARSRRRSARSSSKSRSGPQLGPRARNRDQRALELRGDEAPRQDGEEVRALYRIARSSIAARSLQLDSVQRPTRCSSKAPGCWRPWMGMRGTRR